MCKLKDFPIPSCYGCNKQHSIKDFLRDEEVRLSTVEDHADDEEVVCAIRRSMEEKRRRREAMSMPYDYSWVFPPSIEKLFVAVSETQSEAQDKISPPTSEKQFVLDEEAECQKQNTDIGDEEHDEFYSVESCLSVISSAASSNETYISVVKSFETLSRSEYGEVYMPEEAWRRQLQLIQELVSCEGWPFGLLRKVMLVPPLPSSPSESWSWTKKA